MEPFEISCPHCGGTLRVSDTSLLGRRVRCPKCRDPFTVPAQEDLDVLMAEELEAVGSGIGNSGLGSSGSSVSSKIIMGGTDTGGGYGETVEVDAFDFTPHEAAGSSFAVEEPGDEDDDEAGIGGFEYDSQRKAYRGSDGRYYVSRSQKFPWDKAALIGGPILFLVIGAIFILGYKGYFSSSGADHRQDGRRFQDFGNYVEKNVEWTPEPDPRYRNQYGQDRGGQDWDGDRPRRRRSRN